MRKYYEINTDDFDNTYDLVYVETEEEEKRLLAAYEFDADGTVCARKITKKDAIQKCVRENQRRNEDGTFSGFADNTIHPFGKTAAGCEYGGEYELNDYIWE